MSKESDALRAHWSSLLTEVQSALCHRQARARGGQMAGSGGTYGNAPLSVLTSLERACKNALAVPPDPASTVVHQPLSTARVDVRRLSGEHRVAPVDAAPVRLADSPPVDPTASGGRMTGPDRGRKPGS